MRHDIRSSVCSSPHRRNSVCELNAVVDVTKGGLSHALSKRVDAGLADGRKDGRWKKNRATNRVIALVTVLEGSVSDE